MFFGRVLQTACHEIGAQFVQRSPLVLKSTLIKRAGIGAFAFFLIKGIVWLIIAAGSVLAIV